MKFRLLVSAMLLTAGTLCYGQAVPAGGTPVSSMTTNTVGPNLPDLDGIVHYALSAAEIAQLGYYGSGVTTYSTTLSGDVSYTAKSVNFPTNLILSGGVILANQQAQSTTGYVSAAISQGLVTRSWVFNISDSFSFLPQSPTTGLSGIPGVGDLGATPVQGPVAGPAGGILSTAGNRIANSLSGSAERQLARSTSISGAGSWTKLHFLDSDSSFDNTQITGTVALNRRLDARSSVSLNAVYSTFSFGAGATVNSEPDIETRGINLSYQRVLSRTLSMSVSAGPQWISSSNSTLIPSSINAAASAGLSYQRGFTSASVGYAHGVNGGSGVLPGAISDSVSASLGHTFGRIWVASLNAAYSRSTGLTQIFDGTSIVPINEQFDTVFGGAQLTRRISTHFSGYVSYEAQNQTQNNNLSLPNALNGTSQTFAVGITYTPRSTRLGQF
ncbi:MAG TPA: hypothetical protein VHW70_15855 [Edaphobacter sp.]|nr:hypothetical protein [Edaphobacter sp.]